MANFVRKILIDLSFSYLLLTIVRQTTGGGGGWADLPQHFQHIDKPSPPPKKGNQTLINSDTL